LVHIKQGRFFGVLKSLPSPFENAPVTPPVVWMPHGTDIDNVAISPTQPVYLTSGAFAGQMLVGDNGLGTLKRIFLEKVNNEYQGAVFRFSGGLQAGANRIIVGPDGALYVGGIGADAATWGGWAWNGQLYGLHRMAENTNLFFDVLSARSMGTNTFAVDFTEPVTAATASNFIAQQWTYSPSQSYGCCRNATQNLTVSSVALSANRQTATLTINGLTRYAVIYIRLTGITASSGRALWSDRFWYTLNNFGPGVTPVARAHPAPDWARVRALADGRISIRLGEARPVTAEIRDARGALLESLRPTQPEFSSRSRFRPGVYLVSVRDDSRVATVKAVVH
jgi:hypothetical protein